MDGCINVAEAPKIMVSRRPSNPVEKANPAWMPRPNSPLENTLHNTRVICVAFMGTLIASFQMATERGCAATLDGLQDTFLSHRQRLGMRLAKRLAMRAHNVCDFQCGPHEKRAPTVWDPGWDKGVDPTDW